MIIIIHFICSTLFIQKNLRVPEYHLIVFCLSYRLVPEHDSPQGSSECFCMLKTSSELFSGCVTLN